MRIAIVGGVERTESAHKQLAARYGHEALFHGGHMAGNGSRTLESLIDKSDLVVIVTDVNSHGAVQMARKWAGARGITPMFIRRSSLSKFEALLTSLSTEVAH